MIFIFSSHYVNQLGIMHMHGDVAVRVSVPLSGKTEFTEIGAFSLKDLASQHLTRSSAIVGSTYHGLWDFYSKSGI